MIYTILSVMESKTGSQTASKDHSLPTTVVEVALSDGCHDSDDTPITVLDLSNPKDIAMVTEAGYSIVDLSSSAEVATSDAVPCSSSYAHSESSDTISLPGADDLSDLDPDIARAAVKAAETGTLTPLIKEELKCSIKKKRLEKGQETILVDLSMKKRSREELTPDEEEKRKRRRERNKVAAQKCRNKRRVQSETLEEQSTALIEANDELRQEIEQLEHEREMLRNMLRTHDLCPRKCNARLSDSSEHDVGESSSSGRQHGDTSTAAGVVCDDLSVQMELEIEDSEPTSPFSVELISTQMDQEQEACLSEVFLK